MWFLCNNKPSGFSRWPFLVSLVACMLAAAPRAALAQGGGQTRPATQPQKPGVGAAARTAYRPVSENLWTVLFCSDSKERRDYEQACDEFEDARAALAALLGDIGSLIEIGVVNGAVDVHDTDEAKRVKRRLNVASDSAQQAIKVWKRINDDNQDKLTFACIAALLVLLLSAYMIHSYRSRARGRRPAPGPQQEPEKFGEPVPVPDEPRTEIPASSPRLEPALTTPGGPALAEITCLSCHQSFVGRWNPDGTCPLCGQRGHSSDVSR